MPRGQPDFGALAAKEATASVSDMGEVAARLGSIVTYDKRGDVVEFDNFEDSIRKWSFGFFGAGGYARPDSVSVKSGSQSLHLYVPAIEDAHVSLHKGVGVLANKSLGVEISFSNLSTNCRFEVSLILYDNVYQHQAQFRVDPTAMKLSVRAPAPDWVEVATIVSLRKANFFFHTIKMVVDFNTDKYKRLLLNENEYDISTISVLKIENPVAAHLAIGPVLFTLDGAEGHLWGLDDFVLTQAEP